MSDDYGKALRLHRLLHRSAGAVFVVPLDHSFSNGPLAEAHRLHDLVDTLAAHGADAVVMHKGRARSLPAGLLARLGLIVHLSGSTCRSPDTDAKVLVGTVEEALKLGADAVSVHVNVGAATDIDQLRDLGRTATACANWGIPLLAMMYARGEKATRPTDVDTVAHLAAIATDAGADLVKVEYTGSPVSMAEVVATCSIPLLVAGGAATADETLLLDFVASVATTGAAGMAMGRNVFTSDNPSRTVAQVARLLHEPPDEQRPRSIVPHAMITSGN